MVTLTVLHKPSFLLQNPDFLAKVLYGGEEFVVILPHTDQEGARIIAERLRESIASYPWEQRPVTASFGVATLIDGLETSQQLVAEADRALYASKRGGRNRVTHVLELEIVDESSPLIGESALPLTEVIAEIAQANSAPLSSAQETLREMLASAYDSAITSWAKLLDGKDGEQSGHCERVAGWMVRMAKRAGMNAEECLYARWGALLHDVGTMCLPDSILYKQGELTAEERTIMQNHTQVAYDALSSTAFLRPAMDIPYSHHERWDGAGYPQGLKGNSIPVVARLFAVIDVYDALTHDRPYRKALTHADAIAELRALEGTQLDPRAVTLFLALLSEEERGALEEKVLSAA